MIHINEDVARESDNKELNFLLSEYSHTEHFFPFCLCYFTRFSCSFCFERTLFLCRLASSESSITTKYEKFGVPNYDDDGDGDDDDEGRCFLFDTSTMLEVGSVCVCVCFLSVFLLFNGGFV